MNTDEHRYGYFYQVVSLDYGLTCLALTAIPFDGIAEPLQPLVETFAGMTGEGEGGEAGVENFDTTFEIVHVKGDVG